jgi:tRNA threonylcarbamoyladenosine biosynthesis protein TsaE
MPEQTIETIEVPTAGAMQDLGRRLAAGLRAGDLLVLTGPLGAGKTTLVQGIGEGLGVRGPITSPTFVIARVHPSLTGGPALVHADAYRLGGAAEIDDLDLDSSTASSVTVVEWGEGLAERLSASFLEIAIAPAPAGPSPEQPGPEQPGPEQPGPEQEPDPDAEPRTVRVTAWGDRWRQGAAAARGALSGTP